MNLNILRFHFTSPLHIGSVRADYDTSESRLHSDTLYAAIVHAWSILGITHKLFDKGSLTVPDLGFTLSSLFPFYQEQKESTPIYFFPKPLGTLVTDQYEFHKEAKKVQYLETDYFVRLLKGEKMDFEKENANIKSSFLSNKEFDSGFIQKEVYPRATVSRTGQDDTQIYYIERMFFKGYSGMFCLATFDEENHKGITNKVIAAMKYLESEGIGTDRHIGNGLFDFTYTSFSQLDTIKNLQTNNLLNLSLFCPESETQLKEMLGNNSKWEVIKRGGWITSEPYMTYKKNAVYMFKEGSIFSGNQVKTAGKIVDLKPSETPKNVKHPIYRVGKSLFLPIKIV